jgi:hypothetical protein
MVDDRSDSGAFARGVDNEPWTYNSRPIYTEEELAKQYEASRRRRNARIEWEMNHVDSTWGEKRIIPPPCAEKIRRINMDNPPFIPPSTFPADQDVNRYTMNDVNPVYGMDEKNLELLDTISARTSKLSAAINYINDTSERLDINKVIRMCPFLAERLREVLTLTCKEELKDNLEIINLLNTYIYGQDPNM